MSHKEFGTYQHAGIPYLFTLFVFHSAWQGEREEWLNIKLNTNGFVFQRLATRSRISRHDDARWVRLSKSKSSPYQGILSLFGNTAFTSKIYYNEYVKKVDIKLFSLNPGVVPSVLISFEEGHPEMDYGPDGAFPIL